MKRRIVLVITILSAICLFALSGDGQMERSFRKRVYASIGISLAPQHPEDGVVTWVIYTLCAVTASGMWYVLRKPTREAK